MKEIIETLYRWYRGLLGEGYDNALNYLKTLIGLEIIEIPSGREFGTWTVPDEWIIRDAWVKYKGRKILDFKKQPLCVAQESKPVHTKINLEELKKHLHFSTDNPGATPYVYKFYEKDWAFAMPKVDYLKLKEGDYEVFIDSEFKPGIMKLGVHTIKGETDREILLFAHLDHPFQANDNLSAVACLTDLAQKIKSKYTVKVIFCPETIGSIAYAYTQDLSKVEFMIAVDICGNDSSLMLQKSYVEGRLNQVAGVALNALARPYRKGVFRSYIGSDEYVFNDPIVGIPGLMITTHPYPEYHTSEDTPDKIDYSQIERTQELIQKIIEIYEKDFIPVKNFRGPLMRSRYGVQTVSKETNFAYDMFFYMMDGKKPLSELCSQCGIHFDYFYDLMVKLQKDGFISRLNIS
jgi:aminopeptidase-like protein